MLARTLLALALFPVLAVSAQQPPPGSHSVDERQQPDEAVNKRIRAAEAALDKGDFPGAVTILKELAAERPKDAQVLYDLGFAEERTGADEDAGKAYEAAIIADGTLAEARVALGLLDARAGHTEKAHTELTEAAALKDAPAELRAHALRALATMDAASNPDAARDELLAAVKLTGETEPDITLSAQLASRAGDSPDAENAYRRALAQDPTDADAAASLAPMLQHAGKTAEAEAVLQKALAAHANDPRLVTQLAAVYGGEGKAQQGIDLLTQLRASDPKVAANDSVTRMLARLESMGDKNDDALHLYEGLVSQKPDDPALLDEYGGVLVKLQRFAEAEKVLIKAVGMRSGFANPQDWGEAAGHLAFAASRNKEPKVTLQALTARATVLPNSAASLFLEATAHDSLHETKDAIKAYRAFLTVADGKFPDEEFEARHRLVALEHTK
ncbi:MAG TPA: tetratricopeptide repeat protein [Acidobacteriaceae bacterium]|jgi:Flp pilus assembly protein TadD